MNYLLSFLYHFKKICYFLYVQRIKGFQISERPHLDTSSFLYFKKKLELCEEYLEYGSGGSTILAAQLNKKFTTIESDSYFLKALKKKIQSLNLYNDVKQNYVYVNIGLTKNWGHPLFKIKSTHRLNRWRKYSSTPWLEVNENFSPDLVLVDGRFRIACALKTIKYLNKKNNWEILVDDYLNRKSYQIIEKFCLLEQTIGRLAVFKKKENIDLNELDSFIKKYEFEIL